MRKYLLLVLFLLFAALPTHAQVTGPAGHIRFGSSLPAVCTPNTGDVFWRTTSTVGLYLCLTTNTWTAAGTGSGSGTVNSGAQFQIGYYATSTTAISGNSAILTDATNDLGVGKAPAAKLDVLGDAGLTVVNIAGTQPVAQSGANPGTSGGSAFVLVGSAGGDTSSTTANTNGGAGSSINQTAGAGGQQTGASSGTARGGNGGTFNQTSGAGGNATAVTGTVKGGAGGGVNRTAAGGGTSATSTGGVGGSIADVSGNGGATTAAAVSGAGGAYSGVAGNGGANANAAGTAGGGGNWTADAGAAGANTGGAAAGVAGTMSFGITNAKAINIGNATTAVTFTGTTIRSSTDFAPVANAGGDLGATSFRWKQLWIDQTITSIGTTGNQTINKAAGTVNIAAAATTATVTNSLVTANSLVFIVARTNDTTCTVKNAVPGSGSFVVNMSAACTAATSVGFIVINQ